MIEIVLAGAPMGKERVRFSRATGAAFTPERTVNFEGRMALAAQAVMGNRPLLEGPLRVDVIALMPIAESKPRQWKADALAGRIRPTKKPDYDNFAKILDALNLIVWADDAQIVTGHIEKHYSAKPMMAVRVTEIEQPEPLPAWVRKYTGQDEGVFG